MRLGRVTIADAIAWCLILTCPVGAAEGEPRVVLPGIISDGMVLQSGRQVPIWGTATAGHEISVEFSGQKVRVTAGADGRWKARLGALQATMEPRDLTIRCTGQTITIRGVVVGEVWIAGGQSNMYYPLVLMRDYAKERAAADRLGAVRVYRYMGRGPEGDLPWKKVDYNRALEMSAVAYYFARDLTQALPDTPLAIIETSISATWTEGWMSRQSLEAYNSDPRHADKIDLTGADYNNVEAFRPGFWHDKIISRLVPYGVRGVIWYQGEGNTPKPEQQKTLLPAMIRLWREEFENDSMPFLFCQLPPWHIPDPALREQWPRFREAQAHVWRHTPGTAMVVGVECGAAGTIHPRHKEELGQRLALAARALAYGQDVPYSGPIYRGRVVEGDKLILHFDFAGSGLNARGGGELKQFEVCGADGNFVPAQARIVGQTVVVSNPRISSPVHARYAWRNYPADMKDYETQRADLTRQSRSQPDPGKWLDEELDRRYSQNADYPVEANLYGSSGLPASPFRTDEYPP